MHARLVDVLTEAGVAVVTFDVHFIESRVDKDDKQFAAALAQAGNVVLSGPMTAREIADSPASGVNTASRMDGPNKYLGTEVLLSEESIAEIDGLVAREVGKIMLKGRAQPIVVHDLLGRIDEADDKQTKPCIIFADALAAFKRRSWDEAAEKFHGAIEHSGQRGPAIFI